MTPKPSRTVLALACILSLSACDRARHNAEAVVRENLKDPDSAKFGEFYFNEKTGKGCLTVNARNSMGGYTGDQQAYVRRTDKGWETYEIAEISADSCRDIFADQGADEADADTNAS